jgi:hypothetical protein
MHIDTYIQTDRGHSKKHFFIIRGGKNILIHPNIKINFFTITILSHIYCVHEKLSFCHIHYPRKKFIMHDRSLPSKVTHYLSVNPSINVTPKYNLNLWSTLALLRNSFHTAEITKCITDISEETEKLL